MPVMPNRGQTKVGCHRKRNPKAMDGKTGMGKDKTEINVCDFTPVIWGLFFKGKGFLP